MGKILRWGILGTAGIAKKNWRAIANTGNSTVAAVASRTPGRSKEFISACQREVAVGSSPEPYDSYEEMLHSKQVDAVYIPIPTGVRKEWVLAAADAGKHILCEKPCAATVADLEQMIAACGRKKVQFMDGVMFMHSRRLARLREVLDDGESVGAVKRITSAFTYYATPEGLASNIRGDSRTEPHGCVGDLGWYCIRFALWAMNWDMPREMSGRILGRSHDDGAPQSVITEFFGELIFGKGSSSSFYCAFVAENQQWANISGTKGYIQMNDFVLPIAGTETAFELHKYDFQVKGTDFTMKSNARNIRVAEHSHGHADAQETNMFRNFADQALSGRINESWPEMALKTQKVMCECIEAAVRL